MKAKLTSENVVLANDINAKLLSMDEVKHTALVESSGIKITMKVDDPENELPALIGKKIKIAADGSVSAMPEATKTEAPEKVRKTGCSKQDAKDLWTM